MMRRRHRWQLSLQLKPLFEEFMLPRRMMICLQLRPFLHLWRQSLSLHDKKLQNFKMIIKHWIVSLNQKRQLCWKLRGLFKLPWLRPLW
uniref:Microtubule-associated protein 70-2 n=1 Tax=Rhizophora mucronata TaxID=61149 RepID=A0A2P2M6H2_RHIMU